MAAYIVQENTFDVILNAVESSNVTHIGYNEQHQYLIVRFKNGGEYCSIGVPAEVAAAMAAEPSKGAFYAKEIKGRYECVRLDTPPAKEKPENGEETACV